MQKVNKARGCTAKIGVALIALLGFCSFLRYLSPGNRFSRSYAQLRVSMTQAEVKQTFDREPDYICGYKNMQVLYWVRDRHELERFANTLPSRLEKVDDLPDIYSAAQILVGPDGLVAAFTWNGESMWIQSTIGERHGPNLTVLPETFWKELEGIETE